MASLVGAVVAAFGLRSLRVARGRHDVFGRVEPGGFENVLAALRGDAGVVHEHVEPAELGDDVVVQLARLVPWIVRHIHLGKLPDVLGRGDAPPWNRKETRKVRSATSTGPLVPAMASTLPCSGQGGSAPP